MKSKKNKKTEKKGAEKKKNASKKVARKEIAVPRPKVLIPLKIKARILNANAVTAAVEAAELPAGVGDKEDAGFEIKKTKIRIIGIGGGGGNIVSEIADKVKKSSFWIANTDFQALRYAPKSVTTFQFGENLTHGLGTGMDSRIAEEAANEEKDKIKKMMEGQDLVIIVSALGGGTGSGAAPVFAQISKSLGNLTYGIFTLPFAFEGSKKEEIARTALEKLKPSMNAMTILPNERVFEVVPKSTPFSKTLSYINTMLSDSLEGLIETIYDTGVINIDFADLRAILVGNGKMSFLNTVSFKKGEESGLDSFEKAFSSPLYPYTIDKARGLLLNIVAQKDLRLLEVNKILTSVASRIHKDARIIFGVGHEGAEPGEVKVTVLATGCIYGDSEAAAKDAEAMPVPVPGKKDGKSVKTTKNAVPKPHRKETPKKPKSLKPVKEALKKTIQRIKKTGAPKNIVVKKEAPVMVKKEEPNDKLEKDIKEFITAENPKNIYQGQTGGAALFESPLRKNALQVKKEIEKEELEMIERESAWDVPAFLRKQQKNK
jgi:cell division protein FtsZ